MRTLTLLASCTLAACASQPLPPVDLNKAWVDMFTNNGRLVMAERLDGQRLEDGRYFQLTPGSHELVVRFDYELFVPGGFATEPAERLCYITLRYDGFQAGQRYRLEARSISTHVSARLMDAGKRIVAEDRQINCLP